MAEAQFPWLLLSTSFSGAQPLRWRIANRNFREKKRLRIGVKQRRNRSI